MLERGGFLARPFVYLTEKNLIPVADIKITPRAEPSCPFDHRVAELNHLLNCNFSSTVIAGDLLKLVLGHALDNVFAFWIHWAEGCNV